MSSAASTRAGCSPSANTYHHENPCACLPHASGAPATFVRLPLHHSAMQQFQPHAPHSPLAPASALLTSQERSLPQCIVRAQHMGRASQCCARRVGWYRLASQSIAHIHQCPKPTCASRIPNSSACTVHRSQGRRRMPNRIASTLECQTLAVPISLLCSSATSNSHPQFHNQF